MWRCETSESLETSERGMRGRERKEEEQNEMKAAVCVFSNINLSCKTWRGFGKRRGTDQKEKTIKVKTDVLPGMRNATDEDALGRFMEKGLIIFSK